MRVILASSLLITLGLSYASEDPDIIAYNATPRAKIALSSLAGDVTNTSISQWALAKTGSLGGATVTWVTQGTEVSRIDNILFYNGVFTAKNRGTAGATIGNIVVHLQAYNTTTKKWVTRSSVVADATQDDAATQAWVQDSGSNTASLVTENAASRSLMFTDAATNSTFALVPQVTVAPGAVIKLRFTASFDNNVLALAVNAKVRAQVAISFGNAQANNNSAPNVDINGNGIIDGDELWIRSVYGTIAKDTIPAAIPGNQSVTLTDSPSDIATTGSVTFTNPQITINGLQGTVIVNYNGGAAGGTITNCAHLTGPGQTTTIGSDTFTNIAPTNLTACDTQVIDPHACSPGAPGCGWADGDMVTYNQENWGSVGTTASILLSNQFFNVFTNGFVEIGIPGISGFSAIFGSASAVIDYQPTTGVPGPLDNDLVDPTSTSSGVFGGHVLALQIDVAFNDAGQMSGTAPLTFGNLRVCGLAGTPGFNGFTVREILGALNTAIGGGAARSRQ
jgi:hypothetical protein